MLHFDYLGLILAIVDNTYIPIFTMNLTTLQNCSKPTVTFRFQLAMTIHSHLGICRAQIDLLLEIGAD